ncbi:hypothetical protein P9112_011060 [Eukaryota sp. TZLM1-RC]
MGSSLCVASRTDDGVSVFNDETGQDCNMCPQSASCHQSKCRRSTSCVSCNQLPRADSETLCKNPQSFLVNTPTIPSTLCSCDALNGALAPRVQKVKVYFSNNDQSHEEHFEYPLDTMPTHRSLRTLLSRKLKQVPDMFAEDGCQIGQNWHVQLLLARYQLKHLPCRQLSLVVHARPFADNHHFTTPAIATAVSRKKSTSEAVRNCFYNVRSQLCTSPCALFLFYSGVHDTSEIHSTLTTLSPSTQFIGATTHNSVLTERGLERGVSSDSPVFSMLGIQDRTLGNYFAEYVEFTEDPDLLFASVKDLCLEMQKKIPSQTPLISILTIPNDETTIINAIESVYGPNVQLFGCCAASDHATGGLMSIVSSKSTSIKQIAFLFIYSSCPAACKLSTGFAPSSVCGVVTKANGKREIVEIDGKPAASVYATWAPRTIQHLLEPEVQESIQKEQITTSILADTSLFPLGVLEDQLGEDEVYRMIVPAYLTPELSLVVYADIKEGEEITLMCSSRKQIVRRCQSIRRPIENELSSIYGGLLQWCAAVQGAMSEIELATDVFQSLRSIYMESPFLMAFPYGEIGKLDGFGTRNRHFNLTFGSLSFGNPCPVNQISDSASSSSGELAMLFSDIQDSTRLWCEYPDEMSIVSKMHDEVWCKALRDPAFKAYVVKSEGDSYFIVSSCVTALTSLALYIQFQLMVADYPSTILNDPLLKPITDDKGAIIFRGVRLRFGLDVGTCTSVRCNTVDPNRLDFFGPCVNKTSRITSMATGGQVLVGKNAYDRLCDFDFCIFGGGRFINRGHVKLKGIKESEPIWELQLSRFKRRTYI